MINEHSAPTSPAASAAGRDSPSSAAVWAEPVHSAFALAYLQQAEQEGLDAHALLSRLRLPPLSMIEQQGLNLRQMVQLTDALCEHTGSTLFAFRAGQSLPATTYGQLSLALLSSADIAQALDTVLRYWELLTRGLALQVHMTEQHVEVHVGVHFDVSAQSTRCALEFAMAAIYQAIHQLAPQLATQLTITLALAEPDYLSTIQQALPTLHYQGNSHCLRLPRTRLADKMPMANHTTWRAACLECDKQLALWQFPDRVKPRVQKILGVFAEGFPNLNEVADRLNLSPRTLRRRLADEGSSFSEILEDIKKRDDLYLLQHSNLEIQQIAERLGYQDPANFTRAFRKWGLEAPSAIRQQKEFRDS